MNVPQFPTTVGTGTYYFPNDLSARLAWYHDHAMGITRLNAYAGMATAYLMIDSFELAMVNSGLLPDLVGVPLVIQDKSFVGENILKQDPNWKWGGPGSLWYPHTYEPNDLPGRDPNPTGRWDWGPTVDPPAHGTKPLPPVSCVPEAYFDTIVINGALYPKMAVQPKRTRFRLLNGSQARVFHLSLHPESKTIPGEANMSIAGPKMYQVGTEGGFLTRVAVHTNTHRIPLDPSDPTGNTAYTWGPFNLLLAGGERADVVIDFNGVPEGTSFILTNDAPAPFPVGDPRNKYQTGGPDLTKWGGAPRTKAGMGPNTQTMMKITVGAGKGDTVATPAWLKQINTQLKTNYLNGNQPGLLYFTDGDPSKPRFPFEDVPDRQLTLNEDFDEYGRLTQMCGTFDQNDDNNQGMPNFGRRYIDDPTEVVEEGAIEVWQIMNLTGDTHPIHFHLVDVQIIQRQPFQGDPNGWSYSGPPIPPDPNELGWKETVRMNPGEVTTVIARFATPVLPTRAMANAESPRTGGKEYVWHCHILEHEEHDMMRPIVIK